ncbi:MAG: acetolactate synthase large subunit [Halobacteriota archaeon]
MNVAECLVACLEEEGVSHVFGLPGEENEDLLFALRDSDVTWVPTRHEQGAAFMADVHGRITGDAGVCLGTLGPGATNLITGVADANLDKAPVVAITGQGGRERLHKESHQAVDVVDMFEPITKWNTQLSDASVVHESIRKAFKVAEYEKPGATHVELPEDVAAEETEAKPMASRDRVRRPDPDGDSVRRVAEMIEEADKPLAIVGNGVLRTRASDDVRGFVEKAGVPVASTYMGKGAVSDRDPRSLMTLDSGDHEEAADAIGSSDLVLTFGYDVAEHDPGSWNAGDASVVHVDVEPAEVYEDYDPDVEVVSDIGAAARALTELVPESDYTWYKPLRQHVLRDVDEGHDAFSVEGVVTVLRDVLADDDVLISDVGSHKMKIAQNYPTYEPNTCIVSNGFASMGIAVPGALAADLALDEEVVVATGDGGFLMNSAELETAGRLGCGFTVVVFRDDDYRLISEKQRDSRGESYGTEIGNPDLQRYAEAYGIEAFRPRTAGEIERHLGRARDLDCLALVEIELG